MNDNTNLLTHMRTDPNAPKHQILGAMGCVIGLMTFGINGAILAPLVVGLAIEVNQRIYGGKNTLRESVMDTLTTWLWWLAPLAWDHNK